MTHWMTIPRSASTLQQRLQSTSLLVLKRSASFLAVPVMASRLQRIRSGVWSQATAQLAREHNNANVVSIGARQHTLEEAVGFIDTFIAEPFPGDERHVRRIAQLAEYETTGDIAGKGVDKY
jgi:ribose 5-phosphate isomerase B